MKVTEAHPRLAALPVRLRQTAVFLVETGMAQKQIAAEMGIQPGTLRTHVERLFRALGVHSRAELTVLLRGPGNM